MPRSLFLAIGLGLALLPACAPLAPQYAAAPEAPSAPTRPAEANPVAPTGDDRLDDFLADFAAMLDRHDWRSVARLLDAPTYDDLYDEAVAEGATPEAAAATLIAGALGLNTLAPSDPAAEGAFAGLDRVQVVTLRQVEPISSGVVHIRGDVRLDDDTRLDLNAFVRPLSGRYRLVLSRV